MLSTLYIPSKLKANLFQISKDNDLKIKRLRKALGKVDWRPQIFLQNSLFVFILLKSDRRKQCLIMWSHSFVKKIMQNKEKEDSAGVRLLNGYKCFPSHFIPLCNVTCHLPPALKWNLFYTPLNLSWTCDLLWRIGRVGSDIVWPPEIRLQYTLQFTSSSCLITALKPRCKEAKLAMWRRTEMLPLASNHHTWKEAILDFLVHPPSEIGGIINHDCLQPLHFGVAFT